MATYQVTNPELFNFSRPEEWPKWLRHFERFRFAHEKSEEQQVHTLVYSIGDEADDVLTAFKLTDEERKNYATVKEKFTSYFVKRRNVIGNRKKASQSWSSSWT